MIYAYRIGGAFYCPACAAARLVLKQPEQVVTTKTLPTQVMAAYWHGCSVCGTDLPLTDTGPCTAEHVRESAEPWRDVGHT